MTTLRAGALFAGYLGLERGVTAALARLGYDVEVAWVADIDKGPAKILAHRLPGVPNLGDVTKVDWHAVERVDVVAGGSPCQDLSHAGARRGMKAGTRSGLWASMCDAIEIHRPRLVVWENVRGALSADADSNVEPCPLCVGDARGSGLRALGRVAGDLAELGYDAQWVGLSASDVGGCHGRFRVFVVAWPAADADVVGHERARAAWDGRPGPADSGRRAAPDAERGGRDGRAPDALGLEIVGAAAAGRGEGGERRGAAPDADDRADDRERARTQPVARGAAADSYRGGRRLADPAREADCGVQWGPYAAAVERWGAVLGVPAPSPTETTAKGTQRLSPRFAEWMMGLPAGWVTDVPGITRNEALKALGNGVVPQQCAAAVAHVLATSSAARRALAGTKKPATRGVA